MTSTDIIAAIIEMGKDATFAEVQDLIEGRAMVADLSFISEELATHVSSNERNAASYALEIIGG